MPARRRSPSQFLLDGGTLGEAAGAEDGVRVAEPRADVARCHVHEGDSPRATCRGRHEHKKFQTQSDCQYLY